jgi:hypothetical protein
MTSLRWFVRATSTNSELAAKYNDPERLDTRLEAENALYRKSRLVEATNHVVLLDEQEGLLSRFYFPDHKCELTLTIIGEYKGHVAQAVSPG